MSRVHEKGLTTEDWKAAIDVQSASNLSGVVRSFADIMPRVWEENDKMYGRGTHWVNTHPVCIMFAAQINKLTTGTASSESLYMDFDRYASARNTCEFMAKQNSK